MINSLYILLDRAKSYHKCSYGEIVLFDDVEVFQKVLSNVSLTFASTYMESFYEILFKTWIQKSQMKMQDH